MPVTSYTLHIAAARDGNPFDPRAAFSFSVTDAEGREVARGGSPAAHLLVGSAESPYFAAILEALPAVPDGALLTVITTEEHLHGRLGHNPYLGVLNESPEDRITAGYRKGRDGKGVYKNESQLRDMDAATIARGILMTARRPEGDEEAIEFGMVQVRARDLLKAAPPVELG